MLDQKLAEAMQYILSREDARFPLSAGRERLLEAGIGERRGKSIRISEKDRAEMRSWLETKGYALVRVDLAGLQRHERLAHTPNEKASGGAVKRHRVSVKALPGQVLQLGGNSIVLPPGCHVDANWTEIVRALGHNCLMLVENYANFDLIHRTTFYLPEAFKSPLVVYRGDTHESRADNVNDFLAALELPVLAYVDVDPASLAMASRLPRIVGVVAPEATVLEKQLASPKIARTDRFQAQYPRAEDELSQMDPANACAALWALVLKHRSAVMQERWIGNGEICVLWTGNSHGSMNFG